MPEQNTDHLINECRRIEDDCLYTAEAHYIIAADAGTVSFWIKLIPALAAAVSGAALLAGAPNWIAWFSVIAGVAFALQSIMNPDKKREEHSRAGKSYTALKHESRGLYQTFYKEMDRNSFSVMVRILRERYNMIAKMTPQTTTKAFEEGRQRIKAGRHTPDFEERESKSG
ncbi:MAG: SLATT domain-containing protein [Proteobacteria bacterium]|nr:SLATT domain-containing protein [Pseudomonadota bacterium]